MKPTDSFPPASGVPAAPLQPHLRTSPTSFTLLFLEHYRVADQAGYVRSAITGHIWQARRFLKALNWPEDSDPIRIASDADFKQAAEQACALMGFNPKSSSARSLRSGMARVRMTFLLCHESEMTEVRTPESFPDFWSAYQYYGKIALALGFLGNIPGTVLRRKPNGHLLRSLGIREATVTALRRGISCTLTGPLEERFAEVEKLLRTPPGALTRHITFRHGPNPDLSQSTDHSIRYSQAVRFRYGIKMDKWPNHLQEEVNEFFKGKMNVKWTIRADGYCGTANNVVKKLEGFVGWLCLATCDNLWRSGGGRKLEEIKSVFAELVTPATLDQYREFRLAHTVTEEEFLNGERATIFNNTLRGLYHFAAELLKPPHHSKANRPIGFVYRNPDRYAPLLAHLLPATSLDPAANRFTSLDNRYDQWAAFCKQARGSFFETLEGVEETGKAGKSRPTDAGIEHILALPNPRSALAELLQALRSDYEGYSWEATPHDKAKHCRRQLFFELLTLTPHRVRLWSVLTRRHFEERTSAAGERYYHLQINKGEFKNHRFLDIDYDLDLPVRLSPLIKTYFDRAWPILNAPLGIFQEWRDCNSGRIYLMDKVGNVVPIEKDARYAAFPAMKPSARLFGITFGVSLKKEKRKPLNAKQQTARISESLQRMSESNTCRFLGKKYKTTGFFPQAFRHVIATAEIKLTGSYERAALLLWDSVEMVMKTYSHVKRTDLLAKVVESNEALFNASQLAVPKEPGT
jgi:hypothetical protein